MFHLKHNDDALIDGTKATGDFDPMMSVMAILRQLQWIRCGLEEYDGAGIHGLAGEIMNTDALIVQRFRGLYNTGRSRTHPQGLARRFDFIQAPPIDDLIRFNNEECVIRDEQTFHRFIVHIPDKVMDFVPSPPPSNDPLLQRPKIDFDKYMVLVIISHEPNCFIDLDIVGIELISKAMRVICRYSEPGPAVPKAISYGAYCAAVTRRFDGDIVFVPYPEKPSR